MNHTNYPRWRAQQGPVTMHVEPGKITLRDGRVITTDWYGGPLKNPLAYALRISEPFEVIGIRGVLPGFNVGSVNPGHAAKAEYAVRRNNEPLPPCAIVPDDDVSTMPTIQGQVTIAGSMSNKVGGIEDLTIAGVTLDSAGGPCSVLVAQQIETGKLRLLYNLRQSSQPNAYYGWGSNWGLLRANGLLRLLKVIGNKCGPAREHAVAYVDNAGYESSSEAHEISDNVVTDNGGGRTCIQWVNRGVSGRQGGGMLMIERNKFRCIGGNGGGAITIAGHTGNVRIADNSCELEGPHSGVTIWTDDGKGVHRLPSGHSTGRVRIKGQVVIGGDRPHMAISGAQDVRIDGDFHLQRGANETPEHCIDLDTANGGSINNGRVSFINLGDSLSLATLDRRASQLPGFKSGSKVVRDGIKLTDAQIDAMVMA